MPLSHNVKQFLTNDDTADQKNLLFALNYLSLFEKRCWHSLIRGGFLFKKRLPSYYMIISIGTKIYGNGKSSSLENNNGFGNFFSSTVLKIKLEHNLARPVVTPFHLTWMKYRFLPDLFNSLVPLATHCFHIFFLFLFFFFSFSPHLPFGYIANQVCHTYNTFFFRVL